MSCFEYVYECEYERLCEYTLERIDKHMLTTLAQSTLKPGGSFVCKIFQGEDFKEFSDSVKAVFNRHKIFKPQSTRKVSKEIYIIGFGKK